MLYEKLVNTFVETNCDEYFPISMVKGLESFVRSCLERGKKNISPYQFANYAGITVQESIRFFMFFSIDEEIFKLIYFFDCPHSSCDERIYLTEHDLDNINGIIFCPECSEDYQISDIQRNISVYFALNGNIVDELKHGCGNQKRVDYNSTFDALKELPSNLKSESPLSSDEIILDVGGGDCSESIPLDIIVRSNRTLDGEIINPTVDNFRARLHRKLEK